MLRDTEHSSLDQIKVQVNQIRYKDYQGYSGCCWMLKTLTEAYHVNLLTDGNH